LTEPCSIWRRRRRARCGVPPGLAKTLNRLPGADPPGRWPLVSGPFAQRYRSDFCSRAISGRRRPRCGNANFPRTSEAVATHAPADGPGIEAPARRHPPSSAPASCWKTRVIRWRFTTGWRRTRRRRFTRRCPLIRADLPNAPIEVLPGKCVCEIKHSGLYQGRPASLELMAHEPFKGRRPIFHRR